MIISKDELREFIENIIMNGKSSDIADRLLFTYDIIKKSLPAMHPGDIFKRVDGSDTIVWSVRDNYEFGFLGAHPQTPQFVRFSTTEKWILIFRFGKIVENGLTIVLDKKGKQVG